MLTSLLTATYMFRLVFLTFHGERRHERRRRHAQEEPRHARARRTRRRRPRHGHGHAHGHGDALHDAPPAMAFALIVLAVGSVVAGYVGVPHALGGHNAHRGVPRAELRGAARRRRESAPRREPTEPARTAGAHAGGDGAGGEAGTELTLMASRVGVALAGIGIAATSSGASGAPPTRSRGSSPASTRLLLNKYYVDELYDAAIVQPIKHGLDGRAVEGGRRG